MKNPISEFNKAEELKRNGKYEEAAAIFISLENVKEVAPICYYMLAQISNMTHDPVTAYNLYYKAFSAEPGIARQIYGSEHSSRDYVFRGKKKERRNTDCPLCGGRGEPHWCYPLPEAAGYNKFFNPIRMWLRCSDCNHLFAQDFPEKLFIYNNSPRTANPAFFSYYSNVLSKMRQYAGGMRLFEVGIGACECLLAAREIGYETFGIDVIERHVKDARDKFGLSVEARDFVEYETDQKYDVIIMGDVLEHVSDPICAVAKANELLEENGALWISTPNFESAFSLVAGHDDAMRRQQYHLNYFSRDSLYKLLLDNNLAPVDYQISNHYNGSMEVISIKQERLANI
ncbi:MAG: class I SAM-dependent methyltransferase [Clostridiales Family XIII bacterium]|jgi:SAM-dependent methyltransferase|nr:class I SAM-dependent methyltransferase [Clostridiales Family XIII bacterium]